MKHRVEINEKIFNANDKIAAENRLLLDSSGIFSLNIMASPGAGKTSLIELTIRNFKESFRLGVVDGDIASNIDANRASSAGAKAFQINTGGNCHLDATMLQQALSNFDLFKLDLLIVENVGNLVCPIHFQLGTHKNILIASFPEGDDKPYKYPPMYRGVDIVVINKIDLAPYVNFNIDYFSKGVRIQNPDILILPVSCRTGEGINDWFNWLRSEISNFRNAFKDD